MSTYNKTVWQDGDIITADKMNNIENGIYSYNEDITNLVQTTADENADLYVADRSGNVIAVFKDGHIVTKNFDSADALTDSDLTEIESALSSLSDDVSAVEDAVSNFSVDVLNSISDADLNIADSSGNVVAQIIDGHIKTKNFDSADLTDKNVYITVKKDGTGDFTTLRAAIESITDADPITKPYVIQIYPGTYNLTDEYTQAEIAEADVSDYHNGFVGWMLTDGMSLVGMGTRESVVLSCVLNTTDYNQQIRGNVSTLNAEGNVNLENLTVIADHARYCVHDDFSYTGVGQYSRHVKNCKFIGKSLSHSPACTWGGGMSKGGENAVYENCDFGTDYGHHFDASQPVTIVFKNCRGRKIRLAERGGSNYHHVILEGSDFEMISLMRPSGVNSQHIMVESDRCEKAYVSCYDNDIILTGSITKTALTSLPVGTMVARGTGAGNQYAATADKTLADGIVVANDADFTYVQRTGYINTRILGLTNFSVGDYITLDADKKLVAGGTASNAVGQITFVSNDSDASDQGIGFVKMMIGGMA